jgi:hypothetical protein
MRRSTDGRTETVAPLTGTKWAVAGETDRRRAQYRVQVSVLWVGDYTVFKNNSLKLGGGIGGIQWWVSSVSVLSLIKF